MVTAVGCQLSPLKELSTSQPLEPVNVTSFGNSVFTDVIKLRIPTRSSWIRVGAKSKDTCAYNRWMRRRHRRRGEAR